MLSSPAWGLKFEFQCRNTSVMAHTVTPAWDGRQEGPGSAGPSVQLISEGHQECLTFTHKMITIDHTEEIYYLCVVWG